VGIRAALLANAPWLDVYGSGRRTSRANAEGSASAPGAGAGIQRWNDQLALGRDMLWSPTIRAALLAGMPWLDVFCLGCGTSRPIDLRTIDRHPLASVGTRGAFGALLARHRCRN
jgi:hypothetical protein